MKTHTRFIISFIILALAAILLLAPTALRTALEHNIWVIAASEAAIGGRKTPASPPTAHPNANYILARLALQEEDNTEALGWLSLLEDKNGFFTVDAWAWVLFMKGEYKDAISLWQNIGYSNRLTDIANRLYDIGDLELAAQAHRSAYEVDPINKTTDYANSLQWFDRFIEAEVLLLESLATYPDSDQRVGWWLALGDLYREHDNLIKAEQAFHNALKEDPKSRSAWLSLGSLVYYETGDVIKATEYFQQAISVAPDHGSGYYAMGRMLYYEKLYNESVTWFKQAVDLTPRVRNYWLYYARSLFASTQVELSISAYQEYLLRWPTNAMGYYELSDVLYSHGKYRDAELAIEKALLLVDSPSTWYYSRAGLIFESVGRLDDALKAYQDALDISPSNSIAQQGFDRLTGGK